MDKTYRGKQKGLVEGYVVEAFDQYFEESKDKKRIVGFVKAQLTGKSPKTRKLAKEFLKKWES